MKKTIVWDFDETLVKSSKAFVAVKSAIDGAEYDWQSVTQWNYGDIIPNLSDEEVEDIFGSDEFYQELEIYEGALDCLMWAKENGFKMVLASKGTLMNISKKAKFVKEYIDLFDEFVFLGNVKDKHILSIYGNCLYIDDNANWLKSSCKKGVGILANLLNKQEGVQWGLQIWDGKHFNDFHQLKHTIALLYDIKLV